MGNLQATMTEYFGERNDVAAVENPLLGKSVTIPMYTCRLNAAALVIFIEHVIASAFNKLLAKYITKQIVFCTFVLSVFQKFLQDVSHCLIEGNNQIFPVFGYGDMNNIVIKIDIFYFNVY